jgi:hypothetical protein
MQAGSRMIFVSDTGVAAEAARLAPRSGAREEMGPEGLEPSTNGL